MEGSRLLGPNGVDTRGTGVGQGSDRQGVGPKGVVPWGRIRGEGGGAEGLAPECGTMKVGSRG